MMAASLKDADELVDLLLARDADVNMKSTFRCPLRYFEQGTAYVAQQTITAR